MVALKHYKEHVQEAVRAGADVIISGAGLQWISQTGENNKTKIAPIVSSRRATQLILKMWAHRYNRTADFIVIEGSKSRRTSGIFRISWRIWRLLIMIMKSGKSLHVKHLMKKNMEQRFPVIVAGGIFDRADIDHMIELGADGVQIAQ